MEPQQSNDPQCPRVPPFRIPESILESDLLDAPEVSEGFAGCIELLFHKTTKDSLPSELRQMILSKLSYRELVSLALVSKAMARAIFSDPIYVVTARMAEAIHAKSGHWEKVHGKCVGWVTKQHPSTLWCTHYLCPWYSRKLLTWRHKVEKAAAMRAAKEMQQRMDKIGVVNPAGSGLKWRLKET